MRVRRTLQLILGCTLVILPHPVEAQKRLPVVGFLAGTKGQAVQRFQTGLRQLGYVEGKNIVVEYRYYEGRDELIRTFLNEFVASKMDVIVVLTISSIREAITATKTIPIVMVAGVDPVATGLVESLAQPGGNLTGVTRLFQELSGKRLELLKEIVPPLSRVGILLMTDSAGSSRSFKQYESAGRDLKISVQFLDVTIPKPDYEETFRQASKKRVDALITNRGNVLVRDRKQIAERAILNRLPLMAEGTDFAEAGALSSYSTDDAENFKRAALYVDKILKGAKPADLPIEQPTKFEFVINLKTAKQIRLAIPPNVLARADRVIR